MDISKIIEINTKLGDKFAQLMTPNPDGSQKLSDDEFSNLNNNFKGAISLLSPYLDSSVKEVVFSSVSERDKLSDIVSSIIGDVYKADFNDATINSVKSGDFNDYVSEVIEIVGDRYASRPNNYFKSKKKVGLDLIVDDIFDSEAVDFDKLPTSVAMPVYDFVLSIVKSVKEGINHDFKVKPEFNDKILGTINYLRGISDKKSMGFKDRVNDYFYSNSETEKFSLDDLKKAVLNNGKPYSDKSWDAELKTLTDGDGFVTNPAYINKTNHQISSTTNSAPADDVKPVVDKDNLASKIDEVKPVVADDNLGSKIVTPETGVDKYAKLLSDYKALMDSIDSKELSKELISAKYEAKKKTLDELELYRTAIEAKVAKNYERLSGLESFINEMNTKVAELDKQTSDVIAKTKELEEEYKTSLEALKEAAKLGLFF